MTALLGPLLALMFGVTPVTGSWTEPYGGCKEATLYPHSVGAEECRAHGL